MRWFWTSCDMMFEKYDSFCAVSGSAWPNHDHSNIVDQLQKIYHEVLIGDVCGETVETCGGSGRAAI